MLLPSRAPLALLVLLAACSARPPAPAALARRGESAAARPAPVAPALRLPSNVHPTGYTAELTIDPAAPAFQGTVDIDLEVKEPTDVLWLHGQHLAVKEASLTAGGQPVALAPVQGSGSFLGFALERPLPPGPARLRLSYEGHLSTRDSSGAFRSQEDGEWYVFTQFEPLGARRVFPCFDEPGFKVPWQLTFHVPEGRVAVTNTPLVAQEPRADGGTTFRFARTQPLPSYLIAFGVGPFDFLEAAPAGEKQVRTRIITPRGRAAEGAYAAKVTPEILERLERYFGSPYPYEKLDVIAIAPYSGAMEHPGLVTFSQGLLLAKEAEDTANRQRRFYAVQVHELAHQWFGNLVTMAWWDDLWLNESFAVWIEARITEEARPDWDAPVERVLKRGHALSTDSLVSARRIRQPIGSEDDIHNAFDGITYGKGAAVLAMVEEWLGRDVFRRGIQRYLGTHAGGNATARDFLAALSAEAGQDVAGVLGTFLDQGGAPLVTAHLDCTGKVPVVKLSQRRYLPAGSAGDAGQRWRVPLCVRYGGGARAGRACTVLEAQEAELPLPEATACPTWLLPNADGASYLRAHVDGKVLGRLLSSERRHLTRAERVALLGDVQALVLAGTLPATDALGLLPGLAAEKDRQVFLASLPLLQVLRPELLSEARLEDRARFLRDTYGARALALGFTPRPGEDTDTRLLRPVLLQLAGQEGAHPRLVAEARRLAERWLEDRKAVAPELVEVVLSTAAAHGSTALQARMLEVMRREPERKARRHLVDALSSVREPAQVRAHLALLLDPAVDLRESWGLLFGAAQDVGTRELAYHFVKEHYDALAARMPEGRVGSLAWVGGSFCDPVHRQDVAAFFTERNTRAPGGPRVLRQLLETVDLCIALKSSQGASLEAFLASPKVRSRPAR